MNHHDVYMYANVYESQIKPPKRDIKLHVHVHDKQTKAKIHPGQFSLFFKEKTALGGIRTHDTPHSR